MPDIHSNIINSLSKTIDSTYSGYAPKGMPDHLPTELAARNLTLTVISTNNNKLLLEEQISGKKLLIDKSALEGVKNLSIVKGDNLVLISSTNKSTTFVLEKNIQQYPNKLTGPALQNVAHTLSLQWPDVAPSIIKKTQPVILNQIQLSNHSLQANNLASSIVAITNITGQPKLTVNTLANIHFIDDNNNVVTANTASGIKLQIKINKLDAILLTIPLNTSLSQSAISELTSKLAQQTQLSLNFDVNSPHRILTQLKPQGNKIQSISTSAINEINLALKGQFQQIKQSLSPLVLSSHSVNLKSGIAIVPSEHNLQTLGPVIKQQLSENISKQAMVDTRILLVKNPLNNNKIQLNLLGKPATLSIHNSHLADAKISNITYLPNAQKTENPSDSVVFSSKSINNADASESAKNITKDVRFTASKMLYNKLSEVLTIQGNKANIVADKIASLEVAIYKEMNQVLPRSESMSKALPGILTQLQVISKNAGPELKELISNVSRQIKTYLPASELNSSNMPNEFTNLLDELALSPDNRQIKDVLSSAALPNVNGASAHSSQGVNSQSGIVNGLVTMLQASLQAKLISQQPQLLSTLLASPHFTSLIPKMLGSSKNTETQSKIIQDLNKLDPRGNLIGELNKVISNHSLHKLLGAESTLQNQDSFYYTFPNMFSPQQKDIELLIKREQQSGFKENTKIQQAWQLSMKLDIGENGEVLAKVKLMNENVDLNLYASNQTLKEKILDNLPLLNRRLESLGLSVKPKCYLGKIPSTLRKTDYQVVQTYV